MVDGVVADLSELIDLRRYAQSVHYHSQSKAMRQGPKLSKIRGRGMDFADLRNYQAFDDIRHMEWRVTARTGKPHIKIYEEERERPVVLIVDFNPSMIFGTRVAFKSVLAARLAALFAWTTIKQGDKIGGLFFSAEEHSEFIPQGRESAVLPLLASLSHYTDQSDAQREQNPRPFSDALKRMRRVIRPGSLIVLISDFYALDAESEKHLYRLRAHNDILAYHVCDKIELAPPKPQQYAITDGHKELVLDTSVNSVAKAYAQYCLERSESIKNLFKRLQIPYTQITALSNLSTIVRQTFPLRRSHG